MEKANLKFSYDEEGDVLDISIGKPKRAISTEEKEDFFVRRDVKTKKIVGFSILNFRRRARQRARRISIPIEAEFRLSLVNKEKA